MTVSEEYAAAHLCELVDAAARGEEVEVRRDAAFSVLLTPKPQEAARLKRPLSEIAGSMRGQIWMADDWDSDETNEEIARLFNDGPIFPEGHSDE